MLSKAVIDRQMKPGHMIARDDFTPLCLHVQPVTDIGELRGIGHLIGVDQALTVRGYQGQHPTRLAELEGSMQLSPRQGSVLTRGKDRQTGLGWKGNIRKRPLPQILKIITQIIAQ